MLNLKKPGKKIHQAKIKAGKLAEWALSRVVSPAGASAEFDYITRNTVVGEAQLAQMYESDFFPDNWQSLLTEEELKLVQRTGKLRSIVKQEVWAGMDAVLSDDVQDAKVAVLNYFTHPEGKSTADHVKMEQELWKPVHEARVKDGSMKGWVMLQMLMPFGSELPYQEATVDIYSDMSQYMSPFFEKYFAKVHPGKSIADVSKMTNDNADLTKGVVMMILDRTE